MRHTTKITTSVLAAATLALGLTACGADQDPTTDTSGALVVAASPAPHAEILDFVRDNLASEAGLDLEVKEVTDYVTPNTATEDGSVDANFFQTRPYLDDFNEKNGTHIVPVVDVHLEPQGLYSNTVERTADLDEGATVAIPNDTVNEGRALHLLADAGLITLAEGAGTDATPSDVADNPRKLRFEELEAASVPRSLDDVDAAVVNGNYALDADLTPTEDALFLESAEGNPHTNLLAVKEGREDDPRVVKLAELLTSEEVRGFIADHYAGAVIPAF
ncbi:MetQ/NlpA family ABC transporter substrate-binding protein [Streptomyces sp. ZYX-F-203]